MSNHFLNYYIDFINFFSESKEREDKQKAIVGKFFAKEKQTRQSTKDAKAKFEAMSAETSSSQMMSSSSQMSSSQMMQTSSRYIH